MTLRLLGSGSGYIELKAPASAGDNTLTLPTNNGSANQILKTDGNGNLSWTNDNSGVSLSGSTNNTIATVTGANALVGEGNLTFDGTTLSIVGDYSAKNPSDASYITHTFASNFAKIDVRGTNIANSNHYLIGYGAGHANANDMHVVNTVANLVLRTSGDALTVANNKNVTINDGDLVIGTAGHGINFSATSDAGGMTNELLDDYEEGTFTPTIGFASNSANDWTYNAQQGTYLKVGNLCHFVLRIDIGNPGSGNNGWVEITGLPFGMYDMMSGISYEGTTTCDVHDAASSILGPRAIFYQSTNKLMLINSTSTDSFFASGNQISKSDLVQASTDIRIRGVYRTT